MKIILSEHAMAVRTSFAMASQTIEIVLQNTTHGCKRKSLKHP